MINRITKIFTKVSKSLVSNERHTLLSAIGDDLFRFGKLPLCLIICIIIMAFIVVITTYYTRLLTIQHEQLIIERDTLDIEWRHLLIEKMYLANSIK